MARHPDISEEAIIQAGQELERLGKLPNPGSIRNHLGGRGGLARIKQIWARHQEQHADITLSARSITLTFDALPNTYAENASRLITRVQEALEQLTVDAYQDSQQLFERRLKAFESAQDEKVQQACEAEKQAELSVSQLEEETEGLQTQLDTLADQNAKLLIENAELRGKLAAFDEIKRGGQPNV